MSDMNIAVCIWRPIMKDKEWILGRTALEWLGLPEEQFLTL